MTGVTDWDQDSFEENWRTVHVRVEWLYSPAGRLDHILGSVMRNQPSGVESSLSPE